MIDNKLLSGYCYRNTPLPKVEGERNININTGVDGAKMLIEAYREKGFPDNIIETFIEVYTDIHGWQPLSILIVKNINNK